MSVNREFAATEEVDGHRWGRFTASSYLGGMQHELCFNCGMIRRADKQNAPCKGRPRFGPRTNNDRSGGDE